MPSLTSTTLAARSGLTAKSSDTRFALASVTDADPGDLLVFVVGNRAIEAMTVLSVVSPYVRVARGAAGTACAKHVFGATVYIASPDKFKAYDPVGVPDAAVDTPWINLRTGDIWIAQGDQAGPNVAARYWQLQQVTYSTGALGVRVPPTLTP